MKIAFFELQGWEISILKNKLKKHKLKFFDKPLDLSNVNEIQDIDIISIFIYSKINNNLLSKLPILKMIATRSTGFDHIDLVACKKKKIQVSNVSLYGENTVAEYTFAFILALSRNIHKAYLRTITDDFSINGLEGFDLKGKTLGIIGTGHIGAHVAKIAKGFEMKIIAFDKFPNKPLAKELGFNYVSLSNLLKNSDIITLHVPLLKDTYHLINKKTIKDIKKGAILINTSRGEVIDTNSLLNAIESGKLAGAGLDVIENEQSIKIEKNSSNHKLIHHENVIFTPHIAFFTQEALERILDTTIENINSFIKNKQINILK